MKKRLLSFGLAAVMLVGLLTGCGSTKKIVASETYEVLEHPSMQVDGTWIVPDSDRELSFQADGTYTSTISDSMNGNYVYYKDIEGFALADQFDTVEYVVLSNQSGEEKLFGAVLGDLIVGYYEHDQCYYFRADREMVAADKLTGDWADALGDSYALTLRTDGTGTAGDADEPEDCIYSYDEQTGYLDITQGDSTKQYAVAMYEGYLFLMPVGNYYNMYMYKPV